MYNTQPQHIDRLNPTTIGVYRFNMAKLPPTTSYLPLQRSSALVHERLAIRYAIRYAIRLRLVVAPAAVVQMHGPIGRQARSLDT